MRERWFAPKTMHVIRESIKKQAEDGDQTKKE